MPDLLGIDDGCSSILSSKYFLSSYYSLLIPICWPCPRLFFSHLPIHVNTSSGAWRVIRYTTMMRLTTQLLHPFSSSKQKFFFLFGAPGVGKGTYAKLLRKDLGYNHVSTGDEIRKILKGTVASGFNKDLIENIRGIVKSGGLVSDDIVAQIIQEKVKEPESAKGVILDGFPRTKGQFDAYLKIFPVHGVLNITLRNDILLEKLMGRRTCINCGTGFNICDIQRDGYSMDPLLPKKEGICDACGHGLVIREDDTEKVITDRMREYDSKTRPLLEIFQKMGVLINCEAKRGVKDYPEIRKIVEERIAKSA